VAREPPGVSWSSWAGYRRRPSLRSPLARCLGARCRPPPWPA